MWSWQYDKTIQFLRGTDEINSNQDMSETSCKDRSMKFHKFRPQGEKKKIVN